MMKKTIFDLKDNLQSKKITNFISIKGGQSAINTDMESTNADGCKNSGDCRGSVNDSNCKNTGTCDPK